MSEYQYYEFQAVDRPLTDEEMRELRAVSTRATITPTRFVNEYHWGDFKGNPSRWMERYFDAFLYFANWGTRQLMLRLPRRVLDLQTAARYCFGESATARSAGEFTILEFLSDEEPGDEWYDEGHGALSALIPLRADLAGGDHRALYLGWLLCAQNEEMDEDEPEPPIPPGLGKLTGGLRAFADSLRIDRDLIAAAAERNPAPDEAVPRETLERWIAALPETEKNRTPRSQPSDPRTAAELFTAAQHRADERRRKEAERAARERARREREEALARERRLDELAKREAEAWRQVAELIAARKPATYDEAVQLLCDLRALGSREGRAAEVERRIEILREQHARKSNFMDRLKRAGLTGSAH
jgi:hypothetical protein